MIYEIGVFKNKTLIYIDVFILSFYRFSNVFLTFDSVGSLPDAVNFWMGDTRAVTSSELGTLYTVHYTLYF